MGVSRTLCLQCQRSKEMSPQPGLGMHRCYLWKKTVLTNNMKIKWYINEHGGVNSYNTDVITMPCIQVSFSGYKGMGQSRPGQLSGRLNDTSGARNQGRRHNDNKPLLWKRRYPEVKGGGGSPNTCPVPGLCTRTPAACLPRCLPLLCPGGSWQPIFPRRLNHSIQAWGSRPENRSP